MTSPFRIVIVPGWRNSGPGHWQSLWAEQLEGAVRVQQQDWLVPHRAGEIYGDKPPLFIKPGDRVAQALILPIPQVSFLEVDALSETERGTGGFGSTGQ